MSLWAMARESEAMISQETICKMGKSACASLTASFAEELAPHVSMAILQLKECSEPR
jgi:hypothetical protein